MNANAIFTELRAKNMAGFCYEKSGHAHYRDRVTFYRDGKLLFERFCYGEAAGLVWEMKGLAIDERGLIDWDYANCPSSEKDDAPKALTGAGQGGLVFDGKPSAWLRVAEKKADPAHGYGGFKLFFLKLLGK